MNNKVHNVGGEVEVIQESTHFAMLDELPPKLRMAIKLSPYAFAVGEVHDYYNRLRGAGMDEKEATETLLGKWNAMVKQTVQREAERLYGPTHPQAGQHGQEREIRSQRH